MNTGTDSKGNSYSEVEIPSAGEMARLTLVEKGWDGATPSIRIQIREENGHLRQGPEVPLSAIGSLVGTIVALLASRADVS